MEKAINQDIELRIRLAEYFAFTSVGSFQLGWKEYRKALITHRDAIRKDIDQMETEWQQRVGRSGAETDRLERNLSWKYTEVGYVKRDRGACRPRSPSAQPKS